MPLLANNLAVLDAVINLASAECKEKMQIVNRWLNLLMSYEIIIQ